MGQVISDYSMPGFGALAALDLLQKADSTCHSSLCPVALAKYRRKA
jgi:hypothetical protein